MKITYYTARRIAFTAFTAVTLVATGAAISAVSALDSLSSLKNEIAATSSQAVEVRTDKHECYLVREHEGIIGVFNTDGELLYTVDVYIKTLPLSDRELLRQGIHAKDRSELLEILGDYNA